MYAYVYLLHHGLDSFVLLLGRERVAELEHGLKAHVLFYLERADEEIVLLDVAAHGRYLLLARHGRAVDLDLAGDVQRAAIAEREHVEQRRLAGARRAHYGHELT